MMLEGVVTNVADFGAFVDIGVHQDGLVHVSRLADRFVKDPHEVVKPGDIVRVKVVEVDLKRKRIALTMRFGETEAAQRRRDRARPGGRARRSREARPASRPRRSGEGRAAPNRRARRRPPSRPRCRRPSRGC